MARLLGRGALLAAFVRALRHRPPPVPPVPPEPPDDHDPSRREVGASPGAELLVIALLVLTMLAGGAFAGLLVADPNTQLLGATLGGALACVGLALAVAGRLVVPQETAVEEREIFERHSEAGDEVIEKLHGALDGVTRRRLLGGAAGAAGLGLAAAAVAPVVALGPGLTGQLARTPWHRGRRLVDEDNKPIAASNVRVGSFFTAFPEGADHERLVSPVVLVRVLPRQLRMPAARRDWTPDGIVAYSKICTHAGCAVALYRSPLNQGTQARGPALVCPCHYSTFDVLDGASVEFGPAGRPLPQLPLLIDADGNLRAGGPLSGPVGPSWWGDPA